MHPVENAVRYADISVAFALVVVAFAFEDVRLSLAGVGLSGITEIGLWLWSRTHLQEWPRHAVVAKDK